MLERVPRKMEAIRLHAPGTEGLRNDTIETPSILANEVLVEVHAADITREDLEWTLDRLPALPSYELSGVVAAAGDVDELAVGDEVYALTPFDRDGVAADTPPCGRRSWRRSRLRSATWRARRFLYPH